MKSIRKLSLVGIVGVKAILAVIAVRHSHSPKPSIARVDRPQQIERPILGATPAISTDHHIQKLAAGVPATADWDEEFRSSTDYFPLIAKAGKAALNGDARAAYSVSQKNIQCLLLAHLYGNAASPEERFNEDKAAQKGQSPPEVVEEERKQLHACAGFYKQGDVKGNDVFAELPKREGGYRSPQYWMDLAYQNGDPLAKIIHAATSIGSTISPNIAALPAAHADINQAIASGDPEAIFRAGIIISNGLYIERFQGFALMLAACDLGYDCSARNGSNNNFPFGECVAFGNCQAGSTVSDWVTKNIGTEGYAQAYARAQQIKAALAQGDTNTLQKYAQLKGS